MAQEDQVQDVDQDNEQNQDPTQNLKAEFSRKFQNLQQTNEELQKSNQALTQKLDTIMSHLSESSQNQQQAYQDDIEDIDPYDPKTYEKIKQEAVKEASQVVTQQQQQQNERAQTLSQLINQYPELNDDSSELTKTALQELQNLDQQTQQSAKGYKLAVYEAAQKLGVLPVSKRKGDEDIDDVIGDGGHGMRPPKESASDRRRNKKKEDVDPMTLEIAKLFGLDPSDKKVKERLSKRANRNWSKYE